MKRIFGAMSNTKTMFLQGFKMGAVVGGIFGGLTGLYYAIQTRSFMYIPMIALTSGGSFGFFMGVGMIMRSEMLAAHSSEEVSKSKSENTSLSSAFMIKRIDVDLESGEARLTREPIYKRYQV
jgi:Reactive mitochondrial oxygen species modulator 1